VTPSGVPQSMEEAASHVAGQNLARLLQLPNGMSRNSATQIVAPDHVIRRRRRRRNSAPHVANSIHELNEVQPIPELELDIKSQHHHRPPRDHHQYVSDRGSPTLVTRLSATSLTLPQLHIVAGQETETQTLSDGDNEDGNGDDSLQLEFQHTSHTNPAAAAASAAASASSLATSKSELSTAADFSASSLSTSSIFLSASLAGDSKLDVPQLEQHCTGDAGSVVQGYKHQMKEQPDEQELEWQLVDNSTLQATSLTNVLKSEGVHDATWIYITANLGIERMAIEPLCACMTGLSAWARHIQSSPTYPMFVAIWYAFVIVGYTTGIIEDATVLICLNFVTIFLVMLEITRCERNLALRLATSHFEFWYLLGNLVINVIAHEILSLNADSDWSSGYANTAAYWFGPTYCILTLLVLHLDAMPLMPRVVRLAVTISLASLQTTILVMDKVRPPDDTTDVCMIEYCVTMRRIRLASLVSLIFFNLKYVGMTVLFPSQLLIIHAGLWHDTSDDLSYLKFTDAYRARHVFTSPDGISSPKSIRMISDPDSGSLSNISREISTPSSENRLNHRQVSVAATVHVSGNRRISMLQMTPMSASTSSYGSEQDRHTDAPSVATTLEASTSRSTVSSDQVPHTPTSDRSSFDVSEDDSDSNHYVHHSQTSQTSTLSPRNATDVSIVSPPPRIFDGLSDHSVSGILQAPLVVPQTPTETTMHRKKHFVWDKDSVGLSKTKLTQKALLEKQQQQQQQQQKKQQLQDELRRMSETHQPIMEEQSAEEQPFQVNVHAATAPSRVKSRSSVHHSPSVHNGTTVSISPKSTRASSSTAPLRQTTSFFNRAMLEVEPKHLPEIHLAHPILRFRGISSIIHGRIYVIAVVSWALFVLTEATLRTISDARILGVMMGITLFVTVCELNKIDGRIMRLLLRQFTWWYIVFNVVLFVVANVYFTMNDDARSPEEKLHSYILTTPTFVIGMCVLFCVDAMVHIPRSLKTLYAGYMSLNFIRLVIRELRGFQKDPMELSLFGFDSDTQTIRITSLLTLALYAIKFFVKSIRLPHNFFILTASVRVSVHSEDSIMPEKRDNVELAASNVANLDDPTFLSESPETHNSPSIVNLDDLVISK
jgi:hypothetical protein